MRKSEKKNIVGTTNVQLWKMLSKKGSSDTRRWQARNITLLCWLLQGKHVELVVFFNEGPHLIKRVVFCVAGKLNACGGQYNELSAIDKTGV